MARNLTASSRGLADSTPANSASTRGEEAFVIDSSWQTLDEIRAREEQQARAEALETQALYQAQCDDAASACWYLCRSLGLARQMEADGEPTLELLFQLLGALSDLPAEVSTAPVPEAVGADTLGVFELCQQLAAARELSQEAWVDAELAAPRQALTH